MALLNNNTLSQFSTDDGLQTSNYKYDIPETILFSPKLVIRERDQRFLGELKIRRISKKVQYKEYKVFNFYHSHVCLMIKQLNRYGIKGLLDPDPDSENGEELVLQAGGDNFSFEDTYKPQKNVVVGPYPKEGFDFDYDTPYGVYNWELFFHGPLFIATKLSQNQKFEDAQKWFHYIFDPTVVEGEEPSRYWKVRPLNNQNNTNQGNIDDILSKMNNGSEVFNRQLTAWMQSPFQPHVIARLRTIAYMKSVVMKYLDNLISWGDNLFRRDSIESINEATQLYILAGQILGPKPASIDKGTTSPKTVDDILDNSGSFSNAHVTIEEEIGDIQTDDSEDLSSELNSLNTILYFCTSPNDKLLAYWDTVADRLFKIRNCQNIDGITRSLALFEPPIDPALLVKASAAGLDLGQVINGLGSANLPNYRFRTLVQKALDICNDVKNLGSTMLSALEKKDAEDLSVLRANQETNLLKAIRQVKEQMIEENVTNLNSLQDAKRLVEARSDYYASREYINANEQSQLTKMQKGLELQVASQLTSLLASVSAAIPDFEAGAAGISSPFVTFKIGGSNLFNVLQGASSVFSILSQIENVGATKAGIKGGYDRRQDDWQLQLDLANIELEQIDKQIAASEIRVAISEKELDNHDLQTQQSQDIANYMNSKFTNAELYNWMITQVSSLYFQSYQLAFDVAKMAERAFRHELGVDNASFIEFGHWNSLRKGLLSGEKLQADIRRMEVAYLEQNKREYELTKHVSLSMLAPDQLLALREDGKCTINIPEVAFDLDHPGHYMRRIKSVRLSIPCIAGSYTNVNARLTLLSNRYRKTNQQPGAYAYTGIEDTRFNHNVAGLQSIATSNALNDSGLFELNFQDERFLPFEGTGAISTWELELANDFRMFDYDTISDVIIHMNYTAREGGQQLKVAASSNIQDALNAYSGGATQLISLKTHFPNKLYQLLQPIDSQTYQESSIDIRKEHFPAYLRQKTLNIDGDSTVLIKLKDDSEIVIADLKAIIKGNDFGNLQSGSTYPLPYASGPASGNLIDTWSIRFEDTNASPDLAAKLNDAEVEDVLLVINYSISTPAT